MKKTLLISALSLAIAGPAFAQDRNANDHRNHKADTTQTADRPDAWVLTKVKAKFAASELVDASDINIDVTNGVARLNGTVGSHAEHREAVRMAKETEGVRSVDDSGLQMVEEEEKARFNKNKP